MPERPLRFVHASDFHLDQPLGGLTEVPEHLRDLLIDAPFRAAERVFDTVLAEQADFLLLAGDIIDADEAGPRGAVFLADQFERLAARNIPVYWAGGPSDQADEWPTAIRLPANVQRFSQARPDDFTMTRDGTPIAHIAGVSHSGRRAIRADDFWPAAAGTFSIAVAHGDAEPADLVARQIGYWALGGEHARRTLTTKPQVAHYAGTPQGRHPGELGAHGCTVVTIELDGVPRLNFIPTDIVRFFEERVVVSADRSREGLQRRLESLTEELIAAHPGVSLFITWTIAGDGPLMKSLGRNSARELVAGLRQAFGRRTPSAWCLNLVVESERAIPAEWYEQDTLRGEFLRAAKRWQSNDDLGEQLSLDGYLSEAHRGTALEDLLSLNRADTHQRVLSEATALGAQLLSGEESRS